MNGESVPRGDPSPFHGTQSAPTKPPIYSVSYTFRLVVRCSTRPENYTRVLTSGNLITVNTVDRKSLNRLFLVSSVSKEEEYSIDRTGLSHTAP